MHLYPTKQGECLNRLRLDSSPLGLFRVKMLAYGALVGAVSQNRLLFSNCQSVHSRKFKHLKYSENVKFEEKSNVISILGADDWQKY